MLEPSKRTADAVALASRAKTAARAIASTDTSRRNAALLLLADRLERKAAEVIDTNAWDSNAARDAGTAEPLVDRLVINEKRISAMAKAVREIAALPDPVGEVTESHKRPNGITVSRVRIPLGSIMIVYESRPNVTIDAAALCIKSGNAVILRGGKEARRTNGVLARLVSESLAAADLPGDACVFVDDPDRELLLALLQQEALIDLAIPRGGEGLIRFVAENARVPVIKHYKGVCHAYIDRAADLAMAEEIVFNGKVQRPGVCNALECVLVHADVAASFLPRFGARLSAAGVEIHADPGAIAHLGGVANVVPAVDGDFGNEFLSLTVAVKVVASADEAIAHIARYGSLHTEVIVTADEPLARRFQREVDASMVGWNVSTRFNDGGELGLGAEMGISTTKLHAFGPMGLRELTTTKFVVDGTGQVRT